MQHFKLFIGFLLLTYGFLFTNGLLAQDSLRYENSLLWKIDGKKVKKPSYLYGTIHLICKDDLVISHKIRKAFRRSKLLMLELNTSNPELERAMIKFALMPDSLTLKTLINEEEYMMISAFFKDTLGIPFSLFESVKPIITVSLIAETILSCEALSYENEFIAMANEQGISIRELETIEEQMEVINQISLEDQAYMLVEAVLDYSVTKSEVNRLISAYKKEDLGLLYELIIEQSMEMKEFDEDFLVDRNHKWMSKIEPLIKNGCFIAVGAAHLVGREGLINLLRGKGFTVEAIK